MKQKQQTAKENISKRMALLMAGTERLSTLQKVAEKSGVSYGTVRRLKIGDDVGVSLDSAEQVAAIFGMELYEFAAPVKEVK